MKLGLLKAVGYGVTGLNLEFTVNELYKGQAEELLPVAQQIYEINPALYDGVRLLSGYASYNIAMLGVQNYSNYRNSKNPFNNNDSKIINSMSRKELDNTKPNGWSYSEHNGRVHIKDEFGNYRVRIDPPDSKTPYTHMHIYDGNGNPLDISGNIVGRKDISGHIPYGK